MMVLCRSRCIYSRDQYCARDIIRVDGSGACEQFTVDNSLDVVSLTKEVERIRVKGKQQKAARSGRSL